MSVSKYYNRYLRDFFSSTLTVYAYLYSKCYLPFKLKAAAGDTGDFAGETFVSSKSSELICVFTFIRRPFLQESGPEPPFSSSFRFDASKFDSLCFLEVDDSLSGSSSLVDSCRVLVRFIVLQLIHSDT